MALNINGTTGISGVDGSVSAPALTGTDSNTGITFPSADTIKFATGGVERMSITNSGVSGGGKILQHVHTSGGSQTTIASTTFTDTGGTATITPTSSSSKILVFITQTLQFSRSNTSATGGIRIVRLISGGSDHNVYEIAASGGTLGMNIAAYGNTVTFRGQICANAEDSPNTTTSTTYRVQIAAATTSDSGSAIANLSNVPCQITLLEVAP